MMNVNETWANRRRWVLLFLAVCCLVVVYRWTPGIPVRSGPAVSPVVFAEGKALFTHEWTPDDALARGDGLGPVFNGTSCAECHSQGGLGGGGSNAHNVKAYEVIVTRLDSNFHNGTVHAHATSSEMMETPELLQQLFPKVPGGIRNSNGKVRDLNPVGIVSINSTSLFGDGWIDRIPEQAIRYQNTARALNNTKRELSGDFTTVDAGRPRILADGRIGRFGWKAQFATLEEFVAAACSNEIGLGTPTISQVTPLGKKPTTIARDLDDKQFASLVGFVAGLPRPRQMMPEDRTLAAAAVRGKALFNAIGCACCHTENLGGVKGLYSDLLLHVIEDQNLLSTEYYAVEELETQFPSDHPRPEEWRTAPLWGVADSAPYFHDGGSSTLRDAILRHRGAGSSVTKRFRELGEEGNEIIAFLQTLKAPADAPSPEASRVASK